MSVSNLAVCVAIIGKTGTGKSTIIKNDFKKDNPIRLAIWSPDEDLDNYKDFTKLVVRKKSDLVKEMKKPSFKVVFWPSMDPEIKKDQFDFFCKAVFAAGDCTAIVEELKGVTSPTHAPMSWAILSTRGRKKGVKLYGTSQRPTMIDKDFLGNTTLIYCSSLKYKNDRKNVAESMDIDAIELSGLEPTDEPSVILRWTKKGDNVPFTKFEINFPKKRK